MLKTGFKYLIAYILWVLFISLGFLFLVIGRSGFTGLLTVYYVQGHFQRGMEVQFIDRIFLLTVAIALLIGFIVVEEYFRHGVQRNRLIGRALRVLGCEILLIFAAHLAFAFLTGFEPVVIAGLVLELAVGLALTWFGFRTPVK